MQHKIQRTQKPTPARLPFWEAIACMVALLVFRWSVPEIANEARRRLRENYFARTKHQL
jgi:hypothetical protein